MIWLFRITSMGETRSQDWHFVTNVENVFVNEIFSGALFAREVRLHRSPNGSLLIMIEFGPKLLRTEVIVESKPVRYRTDSDNGAGSHHNAKNSKHGARLMRPNRLKSERTGVQECEGIHSTPISSASMGSSLEACLAG